VIIYFQLPKFFYESQKEGIGDYFWDSLILDIESLIIYGGVHPVVFDYYRMSSKRFPLSLILFLDRQLTLKYKTANEF